MISIQSKTGDSYSFDENTHRLFRNNVFIPRTIAEPVYSGSGEEGEPTFNGIYLYESGEIITLTGNIKKVIDINAIK